jgi:hypothetical protein
MAENHFSPVVSKQPPIPFKNGQGLASSSKETLPAESVREVLERPGEPLDNETRAEMEARLGHDFSRVRIHTDSRAAQSAQDVSAEAYTAGRHIVFRQGKFAPATTGGQQLLAHELIHTVQQERLPQPTRGQDLRVSGVHDPAEVQAAHLVQNFQSGVALRPAAVLRLSTPVLQRQPASLGAIPQTERSSIKAGIIETTVPTSELDQYFPSAANNHQVSTRVHPAAQVVFANNIPQTLQVGLESVSGYLANQTNGLPLNTTINVALDLAPYGGANTVYRFTHYAHTENRTTTNYMLIEQVGATPAAPAVVTATAGPFTVGGQNFTLSGSWSDANFAVLRQALGMLPAASLTAAARLTFAYQSGTSPSGEAGEYDQARDTVTLYSNAFPSVSLRFGTSTVATRNILHEIGHALDLRPLEQAWNTFNQAGQSTGARGTFLNARSLSGSRYVAPTTAGGNYSSDLNLGAVRDGDFRKAAQQDGVRRDTGGRQVDLGGGAQVQANLSGGATPYSDADYQEMFAEAFALYNTDPTLLQQLRPNTYRYFSTKYPRTP